MPTYGQHPSDVVQDSRGNALSGVLLQFYLTEAEARSGASPVGSAVSDQYGSWAFTTDELDLWTRLPNGRVWQVAHSDAEVVAAAQAAQAAAEDAAASAADVGASKLDTSVAASTYATQTALTNGLAPKLDSATAAATYETKANVTSGLAGKLGTATAASTYETKANVTSGLAAKLDSATAASTYETKANVTSGLAGKVSKGSEVLNATDNGIVADGVTVNTAASLAAVANTAASSGAILRLPPNSTIVLSGKATLPANLSLRAENVTIQGASANSDFLLRINSDTRIMGALTVSVAAGASVRGVEVVGSRVTIDSLTVTAPAPGAGAGNTRAVGLLVSGGSDVRVGRAKITNFEYGAMVELATGVALNVDISTYLRGVYVVDSKNVTLTGSCKTASPNAAVTAGHNGLIVESTSHDATTDLRVTMTVSDAGEHGFRVGGSFRVKRVWFTDCAATNVGASGLKILGGTTSDNNYHEDIFIDSFVAEDCGQTATNMYGVQLEFVRRVVVANPIVRKNTKTYSAGMGIQLQAAENVTVLHPTVNDTLSAGYKVAQVLGNCTQVQLIGGTFSSASGNGLEIDYSSRTFRRVSIEGMPQVDMSGGYSLKIIGTGGTLTGAAHVSWRSVSAAANQIDGTSVVTGYFCDVRAPFSSASFKNGSTWFDTSAQVTYRRSGGQWLAQGAIATGSGSPEGVLTAPIGTLYGRTDGGAGTSLYVKESGTGNTGWVAK